MPDESYGPRLLRHAADGAGLVMTDLLSVSAQGRITPCCAGLYRPEHAAMLARLGELVHQRSAAKLAVQLGHAGRRGATRPRSEGLDRPLPSGAWPLFAPSPIPYAAQSPVPHEMYRCHMDRVRDEFVRAARAADQAGADLLQVHCAQGYLLSSFLSPLSNTRADRYGGTLENRMRFPLEVFDAVRAVWPEAKPISAALSATDWAKGGFEVGEAVELAARLKERGCDVIHVLSGITVAASVPRYRAYYPLLFSDRVRNEAGVATIVCGQSHTSDEINNVLAAGRADLCVVRPRHLEEGSPFAEGHLA
jgi:anthraniloyl-CoA monooxygenase